MVRRWLDAINPEKSDVNLGAISDIVIYGKALTVAPRPLFEGSISQVSV